MANPTTGGSGTGSPTIQEIMDLFKQLNPENQSKIMESGMLGLPGLQGNPNNEGSTTPEATEINPVDPAVVESGKTGFFSKARDKAKEGLKDFGKSFKDPNGIGSNMVSMGVDLASDKMNEGLKNSKGFDMANGALSTIADVGKGTWVGYAANAAKLGLNAFNSDTAKETEDFSIDSETREEMGGAYSGSYSDMDEAASLTGKYGGTNKKAFKEAQEKIYKGKQMQSTIQDINADNESRQAMAGNVQLNQMRRAQQLNGGIDFTQLRAAKQGIKLNNINRVKNLKLKSKVNVDTKSIESVKELKKGGNIDFVPIISDNSIKVTTKFVPIISEEIVMFKDGGKTDKKSKNRTIEELIEYAKEQNPRFIQRMSEPVRDLDLGNGQRGTHLMSWGTDDNGNAIVYSEIQENNNGDLFNYGDAAIERALKNKNYLIMTPEEAKLFTESGIDENGNLFGYKKGWPEFFKQNFKEGGSIKESEELVKLEETNQKNIIPEGALHKNKHHIENTKGLTQKGIPVIDNDGEQQAEIELDEIIFTLEVTKKLEELHKIYKEGTNKEQDEAAIEAGRLLVQEILYNTDDRTGLISKCEKGGKLNGNIE